MAHDLGANFAGPEQQIRQSVANFVLRQFRDGGDFFLGVRPTPNRFSVPIRSSAASMLNAGLFVLAQSLAADGDLLSDATLAVKIQAVFARAADAKFGQGQ